MNGSAQGITVGRPKQLIVEGDDEVRLLGALLRHLGIDDVQIQQLMGYDNIRRFLTAFVDIDNFATVRSLAIVADANSNSAGRIQSIRDALVRAELPSPSAPLQAASDGRLSVSYLVVPHGEARGMIEDVCLESVRTDPAMECIDRYFECIEEAETPGPRSAHMSKARLHAFLSSRDDPSLRLGEAADQGIWQFEDDSFTPLAELLRGL